MFQQLFRVAQEYLPDDSPTIFVFVLGILLLLRNRSLINSGILCVEYLCHKCLCPFSDLHSFYISLHIVILAYHPVRRTLQGHRS